MMALLHEKKTEKIIGLLYAVRNTLGGGWSEEIYHQAAVEHFRENQVPTVSRPRRTLEHRGVNIYTFEPDILVWDKIILELKVLPDFRKNHFPSRNEAQAIHYLKCYEKDLALLVNFAHSKVGIMRVAYQPPEMEIHEDYDRIKPHLSESDKVILREVRKHILAIGKRYGTGYPETVYRKIIAAELAHQGMKTISDVHITAHWKDKEIGSQLTQHILVADRFLIHIRATLEMPSAYDYTKTRTFLDALGLKIGLVVNFGRNILQVIGTAAK